MGNSNESIIVCWDCLTVRRCGVHNDKYDVSGRDDERRCDDENGSVGS